MKNKDISFLPSIRKAKRLSQTIDQDQASEFFEILKRTYKTDPDPKDIQALRKWVEDYPEIWTMVFDMSQVIESNLINRMAPNQAAFLALEKNVDEIREDLAYDEASPMERMLIDSIVVS